MAMEAPPPRILLRTSYPTIVVLTAILQTVSLIACGIIGLYLHAEKILHTHCFVDNFLPSISAIIGHYYPERYIWRVTMAMVFFPKTVDGYLYYEFFSRQGPGFRQRVVYKWLNRLNCLLHFIQWALLLTVSYVTSKENRYIHNNSFFIFLVFSTLHMLIFLPVLKRCEMRPVSKQLSLKWRRRFTVVQVIAVLTFAYLAYRHNTYCEPFIYSYLAFCEYIIGCTYTGFHAMAALDFKHYQFSISL